MRSHRNVADVGSRRRESRPRAPGEQRRTSSSAATRCEFGQNLLRQVAVRLASTAGSSPSRRVWCAERVCLELFAGLGAPWFRAMRRKGFSVVAFEVKHGAQHDLARRDTQELILAMIRAGRVEVVHIGTLAHVGPLLDEVW